MSTKGVPREPYWTEAEIDLLRAQYVRVPVADIAAQLGRSYEAVRRKASKVGVQHQGWTEKFTAEEDALLAARYAASPMSEMTALLGRHPNSIRFRARALGLVNPEQVKRRAMASGLRHDYFTQVDGPVKAYLVGLMATDGTIGSRTNSVSLKLGVKDIGLTELMRDEIAPNHPVRTYVYPPLPGYTREREVAHFTVSSAQLKADLGRLGVVPRKTFITRWPDLDPQLAAPFILGCFDGDGMLRTAGQPGRWQWSLYSASEQFLVTVHDVILRQAGFGLRKLTSKRGLHELRLSGARQVVALDAWLHAEVPGLSRKRVPPGAYARAKQDVHDRLSQAARKRSSGTSRSSGRFGSSALPIRAR